MFRTTQLRFFEAASVLLFFLQALRVIFSVMFGIIYDQIFAGSMTAWLFISMLLVLLAFLVPSLTPATPGRGWLALLASLAAAARVLMTLNNHDARFWTSLVILAAGGLYLASLILTSKVVVMPALIAAIALDQLFRLAGDTFDLSLRPVWLPVQAVWGIALLGLALWLSRHARPGQKISSPPGVLWGLAFGSFLFLESSLLALPNAIARWSGWSYSLIAPLLMAITLLLLISEVRRRIGYALYYTRGLRLALSALLLAALPAGYFLSGLLSGLSLLLAYGILLTGLVSLLDQGRGRRVTVGPSMALGMVLLLLLNFFNAFAFTYPYTLPIMRGLGWLVYLAAACLFAIGLSGGPQPARFTFEAQLNPLWTSGTALLTLGFAIYFVRPLPAEPMPDTGTVRAATYNIHYGYDNYWHTTLEDIAQTIEASGADLVAMQEVDTGRLTSYASDNAYYLARRLRMNVAYMPAVERLTGIALLYHGSTEQVDWQLLTSLQEQTGIIHVQVRVAGQPLHAFAIWMGLSEENTDQQIREALDFIGPRSPATFGGDFNARLESPVGQAVQQAGFVDPFTALNMLPVPPTSPAINPQERIDFVWLRGLEPKQAWVNDSLASDHRMVLVEFQLIR